jgi:Uma2 family endonuclease
MPPVDISLRPFEPGTTGWSASDLDDPQIERLWFQGRYEIIDGVLTTMAPAYFTGHEKLAKLMFICQAYVRDHALGGAFAPEIDIIIDETRVVVADAVYLTDEDKRRQEQAAIAAQRVDSRRTRILVPPTLIIESVSPGHEQHDRRTKLRWYAEFRVPNYWILDAFEKTLACWVLDGDAYRLEQSGGASEQIRPGLFPGLAISLSDVWRE